MPAARSGTLGPDDETSERGGDVRLRPGVRVLWRGPTTVQLGTDERWAVALTDLEPAAVRALHALPPAAEVRVVADRLAREGVPEDDAAAVLRHLRAAGLLVPTPPSPEPGPDATAWALLAADGDGAAHATRRGAALVRVVGLGRVGAVVATTLAAAGVGALELEDDARVGRHDVGLGGLGAGDLGLLRTAAVERAVRDAAPGVRLPRRGRRAPDLVVLVETDVADPLRYRPLLADDVPHLSVVVREASVLVGPLVVPGRTACLRCVDLHRADADPGWPALAAQLALPRPDDRGVETLLAAAAGALAAAQAVAHLDGRRAAAHDGALELRLPDVVPRSLTWPPHPRCGCVAVPV